MEPNEERQRNDKKAERLAKRRERRRQRLLEETAEEREARLGKRREAWKKRLLKRKVMHLSMLTPRGGGRAKGGDLINQVVPLVGIWTDTFF